MKLFEPGTIGKLEIKNRIVMAAMGIGGLVEPDGKFPERIIDYYVARARGGTGLIITTSTRPSRKVDQLPTAPFVKYPVVDSQTACRIEELANAVHDCGAKIALQILPSVGKNAPLEIAKGFGALAPSSIPCLADQRVMAREITLGEIEEIEQSCENAARIAKNAGIDAIELNCHFGYLPDEFCTSLWNKRTDKYGGNLDGRLRFNLEIIERMKKGAGADFPIMVKFGLTHYIEGGREIEEGLEIARRFEAAGVAALEIDGGCHEVYYWCIPPSSQPPGCLVDLAEKVKKVVKIPVIAVGKLGYPELAEKVLQEGKADFIGLGRALLADPDWANKVKAGRLEDIRPCIGCLEGCHHRTRDGKYTSCAVNPATGMEREFTLRPAERKKSVVVVGGGPGGMEAARVAALKGHKVTLFEKSDVLGGNLLPAGVPEFKQDYRNLIKYLSVQLQKLGVDVKLKSEAKPEMIKKMKPDAVFVATGSKPIIPRIPGVERKNVVTAIDALLGKKEVGERVVVVGGGLVGCEAALYFAQMGKKVTVVEILDGIMRDMYPINRAHILVLLAKTDAKILTQTRVLEITDKGVVVADKDNRRSNLDADTVVLAIGLEPDNSLVEALRDKVPELYAIGDCAGPRKVMSAMWEGFRTARLV